MSDKMPAAPPEKYLTWPQGCSTYTIFIGERSGNVLYRHSVNGYYMSCYELTNRELAAFMADACRRWLKTIVTEEGLNNTFALMEDWQSWGDKNG